MAKKNLVLLIEDSQKLDDVVAAAKHQGFTVERVFAEIGSVFGSADESDMLRISSVLGVESLQEEPTAQLPPPNADGPF